MMSYMLRPALKKYEPAERLKHEREESLVERILSETCFILGTDRKSVLSKRRDKELCMTRHITTFLWRRHLAMSHKEVVKRLGRTDHTSSVNSMKQMRNWLATEPELHMTINLIENKIQ